MPPTIASMIPRFLITRTLLPPSANRCQINLLSLIAYSIALVVGILTGYLVGWTASPAKLLAIVPGLVAVSVMVLYPEWGLLILVFMTYTRLSDILVHYHGLPSIAQPLFGLLLLTVLAQWKWYGKRLAGWQLPAGLVLGYGILGFFSFINAEDLVQAQTALSVYSKNAVLAIMITLLLQRMSTLRHVIWVILAAGIWVGSLSVHQQLTQSFHHHYWGFSQAAIHQIIGDTRDYRLAGPIGDPNFYAQILIIPIFLAFNRLWYEQRLTHRLIAAWAFIVCSLSLVFTFSRGALVAVAAVLGLMLIRRPPRPAVLVLAAVLLIPLIRYLPAEYTDRMHTLVDLSTNLSERLKTDPALQGRLSENLVGWLMFLDHPVLGVGLNNYQAHYRHYARQLGMDLRHEDRSAHNLYLQVMAETGLLGMIAFSAILWIMLRKLQQSYTTLITHQRTDEASIILTLRYTIIGYLIAAVFLHSAYPRYFWLLFGIAMATPQAVTTILPAMTKTREPVTLHTHRVETTGAPT